MSEKQIKYWTWTARVTALLGLIAGVLAAADKLPEWFQGYATITVALMGVGNGWIRGFLPAVKSKVLPATLLILSLGLMLSACPDAYRVPYATMDNTLKARNVMASKLASNVEAKHAECLKTSKTADEYRLCIAHHHMLLAKWQRPSRVIITSAVRVAAVATGIAKDKGKKLDPKKVLLPIGCAAARAVRDWGDYIPDEVALLKQAAFAVDLVTCPKTKMSGANEAGAVIAGLGELLRYIAATLSEPVESIRKRLEAELAKPITDATDPILKLIEGRLPK